MNYAIISFRKRRNLTQEQLGSLVGVQKAAICKWEYSAPPPEMAIKLEKATKGELARWMVRPDLWEQPSKKRASI